MLENREIFIILNQPHVDDCDDDGRYLINTYAILMTTKFTVIDKSEDAHNVKFLFSQFYHCSLLNPSQLHQR